MTSCQGDDIFPACDLDTARSALDQHPWAQHDALLAAGRGRPVVTKLDRLDRLLKNLGEVCHSLPARGVDLSAAATAP